MRVSTQQLWTESPSATFQESYCLYLRLMDLDGAPSNPEPFHLLYFLSTIPRNLLPRSVAPSISFLRPDIHLAFFENSFLSINLPNHLSILLLDIQRAYGLYSRHLSISEHLQHHIFELVTLCSATGYLLLIPDIDYIVFMKKLPFLCEIFKLTTPEGRGYYFYNNVKT